MVIKGFPLGPSVNAYLRPLLKTGRFVKTVEGQIYDRKVCLWQMKNGRLCDELKMLFQNKLLRLDFHLVFNRNKFIGKKQQVKKKDYKNHIKTTEDAFFKCLNLDDSYVKSGHTELIFTDCDTKEQAILNITILDKIKTLDELIIELFN